MPHPWRTFGFEVLMYVLSLLLGLLSAVRVREIFEFHIVEIKPVSAWEFILPFLLVTSLLLLIIYLFKNRRFKAIFFKVFFLLAVVLGDLYFFGLWFPYFIVFPLAALFLFLLLSRPSPLVHNTALIFAIAGMGAAVGSQLTPETVILLFLLFALYDFVAVYKTKHMVKMAEAMIENKAIVGLIIPPKASGFQADLNKMPIKGNFLVLGGGDVIFPLLLAVSMLSKGFVPALLVVGFSLLGLLAVFLIFISQKTRKPMPALPPLALFCAIGYLLSKLI